MRILFILDPLEKLDPEWDTSLALLREFQRRGHEVQSLDVPGLLHGTGSHTSLYGRPDGSPLLMTFDLILIRKEPPVDDAYLRMIRILEEASGLGIPVLNHPKGIRETNEKECILNFPDIIPESIVSSSVDEILKFQDSLNADIVIKPLNEKGGKGIFCFPFDVGATRRVAPTLKTATQNGRVSVMAQRHLPGKVDKRILILDGKILTAFERHAPENDFRTNLSLGGTYHATRLSPAETAIVERINPYLQSHGLPFVGMDVMNEKLIEVNVTCPAGICEAKSLYPEAGLAEAWADSLEAYCHQPLKA